MSIKLKGSSDGSVSLDAPADTSPSGTDITLTLPTSAGSANQFLQNSGTAGTLEYSSMVEDSSGQVGIGTTSPSATLHVAGPVKIDNANATNELTFTGTDFTNVLSASTSGFQLGTTGAGYLAFLTNNTEEMRLLSGGGLTFNGDTAAANALSDYEEGTFTPTINTGFTASYNSQSGRYTKVGNVVHFFISIDLSSLSGSSSDTYAEVEGLPFTATSSGNIDNAVTVAWQYALGNSVYHAYIEQGGTHIVLLGEPVNGSRTHWNPGQVWDDNDSRIALSGTYTTNA